MKCPSCHSDNRDGAKFCNECGTALDVRRGADDESASAEDASKKPSRPVDDLDAEGKTRVVRPDTSGVDECLIDSTYVPCSPNWRAGDTMEIPRIHGSEDQQPSAKAYRAPDARPKKSFGRRVGVALLCVAVIAALAAAGTYHLEASGRQGGARRDRENPDRRRVRAGGEGLRRARAAGPLRRHRGYRAADRSRRGKPAGGWCGSHHPRLGDAPRTERRGDVPSTMPRRPWPRSATRR